MTNLYLLYIPADFHEKIETEVRQIVAWAPNSLVAICHCSKYKTSQIESCYQLRRWDNELIIVFEKISLVSNSLVSLPPVLLFLKSFE